MPQTIEKTIHTEDHRGCGRRCRDCAEFNPSDRLSSVGACKTHASTVLAQDVSCASFRTFQAGGRTIAQWGGIQAGID